VIAAALIRRPVPLQPARTCGRTFRRAAWRETRRALPWCRCLRHHGPEPTTSHRPVVVPPWASTMTNARGPCCAAAASPSIASTWSPLPRGPPMGPLVHLVRRPVR